MRPIDKFFIPMFIKVNKEGACYYFALLTCICTTVWYRQNNNKRPQILAKKRKWQVTVIFYRNEIMRQCLSGQENRVSSCGSANKYNASAHTSVAPIINNIDNATVSGILICCLDLKRKTYMRKSMGNVMC